MKKSILALALLSGVALAGSASAQDQLVNGVAGSNQPQMAPVGTKAPNSGNASSSTTIYSDSKTTAMNNSDSSKAYPSDSTPASQATGAPNQLVNGVAGSDQPGMAPVGTKAPNSGANSTGPAPAQ